MDIALEEKQICLPSAKMPYKIIQQSCCKEGEKFIAPLAVLQQNSTNCNFFPFIAHCETNFLKISPTVFPCSNQNRVWWWSITNDGASYHPNSILSPLFQGINDKLRCVRILNINHGSWFVFFGFGNRTWYIENLIIGDVSITFFLWRRFPYHSYGSGRVCVGFDKVWRSSGIFFWRWWYLFLKCDLMCSIVQEGSGLW